jgi:putative DNA primase/helicase
MQIHEVSDYVTWDIPRPQFYIKDILPKQGSMLLYGSPKIGKSWMAMQMGLCISLGEVFLGFRTEQAKVIIVQFEISPSAYFWRLRDMIGRFQLQPGMLYEASPGYMSLERDEVFNPFAAAMVALAPQVIILDCLAACFSGDENSSQDMASFINKMEILKANTGASLVIVHHDNKNLLSTGVNKARGHSRLTGWVDTLTYMVEQPTGIQLQFKARQATRELHNINVVFEEHLWRIR